jgi:hypothetical protein
MDQEKHDTILHKLLIKVKPWFGKPKPQLKLEENESEIGSKSTIKNLLGSFNYKSVTEMTPDKYKILVERLGESEGFNLSKKDQDSMLDALDCKENEERFQYLGITHGEGYIYLGWFLAKRHESGEYDLAYVIYSATFRMAETKISCVKWWYFIPYWWEYKIKLQEPTLTQKNTLEEWCKLKFYNEVKDKFHNI